MDLDDVPDRTLVAIIGLLVLLAPATLLVLTLAFLSFTGDAFVRELTLLEIAELYLLELVVLAGFSYGLYRLVRILVVHQLPASLDDLARDDESVTDDESLEDPNEADEST